jgi:hypothetical protein
LKATFKLSIVREKQHKALFNMPLDKTEDYKNGVVLDKFKETVNMSSYLVAFVVCDYESKSNTTKSGIEVSIRSTGPYNVDLYHTYVIIGKFSIGLTYMFSLIYLIYRGALDDVMIVIYSV